MQRHRVMILLSAVLAVTVCLGCSGKTPGAPTGTTAADIAAATGQGNPTPASNGGPEYADVSNQGGMGVYAANGAMLVRQPNGFRASITIPTPQPGTYNYPAGREEGHPEVFTLWAFVFNYPDLCSAPCNADDLGDTPAKGGVYNVGGHVASGASLTIAGRIGVGETPFGGVPLESPSTAEIHLAVAPHGELDPTTLPSEFRLPTGPMSFWWVAIFD